MATIGILYAGHMGAAVAAPMRRSGHRVVTTLEGRSEQTRDRARDLEVLASLRDVVREADVLLSLVPPSGALAVATSVAVIARELGRSPIFIDANAISPGVMQRVDEVLTEAGVGCVDGAITGSAIEPAACCLYLSGALAKQIAPLFDGSIAIRVLGERVGTVSAFKLIFSGLLKGTTALIIELGAAAERVGVLDEMLRAYADLPSMSRLLEHAIPSFAVHAPRRAEEVRELEAYLAQEGLGHSMAQAIANVLEHAASLSLPRHEETSTADVVRAVARGD